MCVHACSSVLLSVHPEHVSLVACLLASRAGSKAVLDGSSLFFVFLPLSLWARLPTPQLDWEFLSERLRGSSVGLWPLCDHKLHRGCCPGGCGPSLFLGQDLPIELAAAFCPGPVCSHSSLLSNIFCTPGNLEP